MKKIYIFLLVLAVGLVITYIFTAIPTEEVEEESTLVGCDFVVKTNGGDLHISEPSAGMYKYDLLVTPDGYIEVWKCQ